MYLGGYSAAPNFLELTPAPEALGSAITAALAASHTEVNPYSGASDDLERSERWKAYDDWCEKAVCKFDFKDRQDLFKPMRMVSVVQKGLTITLTPSRQTAWDVWDTDPFSRRREQTVSADSEALVIGEAALAALAGCGSRFGG